MRAASPGFQLDDPVGRPGIWTILGIDRTLLDEITRRDDHVLDRLIPQPPWSNIAIARRALGGCLAVRI